MTVSSVPNGTWILLTDTDSYAGNFERDLVAFCTGQVGECGVGDEEAELYAQWAKSKFKTRERDPSYVPFTEMQGVVADDGCPRPASIWHSPDGHAYNSVAAFFYQKPTELELAIFKARAFEYTAKHKINILGFRLLQSQVSYVSDDIPIILVASSDDDLESLIDAELIEAGFQLVADIAGAVGKGVVQVGAVAIETAGEVASRVGSGVVQVGAAALEGAGEVASGVAEGIGSLIGSILED